MVGLSVILESYRDFSANKFPRVISKGSIVIKPLSSHSSSPNLGFLHCCFLCKKDLCPNKDIYMYKGDKAFCSVECRCRQMLIDEEEESSSKGKRYCTSSREYNCSLLAAIKAPRLQQGTTSPPSYSRGGRGPRTRHNAF